MGYLDQYKVDVPEGRSGKWRVERFTVNKDQSRMDALSSILHGSPRHVLPGTYTRLLFGPDNWPTTVMSDTPDEIRDHLEAIRQAQGECLVNGLGLGMVVQAMLEKPGVERVTVIEISPEVISLVGPHYKAKYGDRLEIVQADALAWQPPKGVRYGCVWHDIWSNLCSDNLKDMKTLHRKYGRRCDWQGSWGRYECERLR